MEIAKHRFSYRTRYEEYRLRPVGDVHLGSAACDEKAFEATIEEIAKDDHSLMVLMGDLIEGILHDDPRWDARGVASWCYEKKNRANIAIAQRDRMLSYLKRVPSKRILAVVNGNHEDVVRHRHMLDVSLDIARELGAPYLGDEGFIQLGFSVPNRKQPTGTCTRLFDIFVTHGHGGGRKIGGKANRIVDVGAYLTSDITIMGHVHDKFAAHSPRLGLDTHGNFVSTDRVCVLSGCFLKAYMPGIPSYAARALFPPTDIGSPVIHIRPNDRMLRVTL